MNTKLIESIAQIILSLSPEERQFLESKITNLAPFPTTNQSNQQNILDLENRLKQFEKQYQMSSNSFYLQFKAGKLGDTMDFFEWSVFYEMWNNAQQQLTPTMS
jgi:midasin (ATPase involved in ribosome maturation)